jgi:hypothetical protein
LPTRRALEDHRVRRTSWYGDLIGPLLLPASCLSQTAELVGEIVADPDAAITVGVVADSGPAPGGLRELRPAVELALDRLPLRQIEVPVAMRNEDPVPGLRSVLDLAADVGDRCAVMAEIPLTWGLLACLDRLAEARADGVSVIAKLRTGGLALELFPTPMELAAVICACRDRELPFALAAGRHRAVRRTDPETGLVTHGFVNVLGAVLVAAEGGEPVDLAEILGSTDPQPVVALVASKLRLERPLWDGLGASCLAESLADLTALNLLAPPLVPPL